MAFSVRQVLLRAAPLRLPHARRLVHCGAVAQTSQPPFHQPRSPNDLPRFAGVSTMMRLPLQEARPEGLDACFVGVPLDIGCTHSSGTRHGPQAIRQESRILRPVNMTGAVPFESMNVADIGDVPLNPVNLLKCVDIIADYYHRVLQAGCVPLTLGGDHTLTYPILKAMAAKHGPVGLIQVDAHHDLHDVTFGEKIAHGTVFRRAIEEELISPQHVVQIGLRGGLSGEDELMNTVHWGQRQGIRMVFADECWHKSLSPLMEEVREQMGDRPVYLTFDIDGIEMAACPGTGVGEVGGLTPIQALEIVRGCRGLNMVGGDVVEVNPLFDQSGTTAVMASNLLFETLSVLPGVKYHDLQLKGKK